MVKGRQRFFSDLLLTLAVMVAVMLLQWQQPRWLERLEGMAYDIKLLYFTPPRPASPANIQIVDIDEQSLQEIGRWPWPRKHLAALVEQLTRYGAIVISFDMMFSEPQQNPVARIRPLLEDEDKALDLRLAQLQPRVDDDSHFAAQIANNDVVLASLFQHDQTLAQGQILPPQVRQLHTPGVHELHRFAGFNASIAKLNARAQGQGFINAILDVDGIIRRAALLSEYRGQLYPSLALETFRVYSFAETITPVWHKEQEQLFLSGIKLGQEVLATDNSGQLLIPYKGPARSYPYSSASDVIRARIPDQRFDGAVVFVGTSSVGMADLRSTPVSLVYPGIEIHASVFDALTQPEQQVVQPHWWLAANMLQLLICTLLLTLLLLEISPALMALSAGLIFALAALFNIAIWYYSGIHLPVIPVLCLVVILSLLAIARGFYRENLQRRQVKAIFDQYVPPAHIDRLLEESDADAMAGERKELTVLFADIRDFTRLSESLSANELKKLLNAYFSPVTEQIFQHQGTIDKYVGDMVMAFWGAPLSDKAHGPHALDAAFAMLRVTESLSKAFAAKGWPEINIGIGLNSGEMNVGDMGSSFRRAYTVLGDAVNLGSRLEGLTKYYGLNLLVSEFTKSSAPHYLYQIIDKVRVKGKAHAITIYRPFPPDSEPGIINQLEAFNRVFALYRQQAFTKALTALDEIIRVYDDKVLHDLYRQRIHYFIDHPPGENWDGAYTHTSK
ncbi:CHASE2 domain-containing protein [Thalassomonas haliotis]|uniref:Adenylate/guanylate cyclase domain-containing protein n=1 Tax=Thalassomonas haliotis TaxID=485448 RepID=A0ABY7VGF7_9GAMM|nr:adenylate/guanylate cyclase domain-containing protein [Thalassomonas haliotis]WDE12558.1 adenylate/guanylate cyclase domain-containing protein [Thalassomonas haliotis]